MPAPVDRDTTGAIPRVLYAEDDPQVRKLGCQVLARSGYQVDGAVDGEEAWSLLKNRPYDLLITDFQMPRLCGPDLIRRMRREGMRLPVLIASGSLAMLESGDLRSFGDCASLAKPFNTRELLERIAEILGRASDPVPSSDGLPRELDSFHSRPLRHQGLNE